MGSVVKEPTLISSCLRVRGPGIRWADAPVCLLRLHVRGRPARLLWASVGRDPLKLTWWVLTGVPSLGHRTAGPSSHPADVQGQPSVPSHVAAPAWQLASSEAARQSAGKMEATACGLTAVPPSLLPACWLQASPRPPTRGKGSTRGCDWEEESVCYTEMLT